MRISKTDMQIKRPVFGTLFKKGGKTLFGITNKIPSLLEFLSLVDFSVGAQKITRTGE